MNISTLHVGAHAPMDVETEDLIRGTALKNGMIVLIEGGHMRETSKNNDEYTSSRRDQQNRWCEVTDLRITRRTGETNSPLVEFIGLYGDGTKHSRTYDSSYCWVVKKASIPHTEPKTVNREDVVGKMAAVIAEREEGFENAKVQVRHARIARNLILVLDILMGGS